MAIKVVNYVNIFISVFTAIDGHKNRSGNFLINLSYLKILYRGYFVAWRYGYGPIQVGLKIAEHFISELNF